MNQNLINKYIIESVIASGKILRSAFESNLTKETSKSNVYYDVVSKADIESEKVILKIIKEKLPGINILSEEKGFINNNSEDTIVIDPLDGSSNFLLGLPHFSVSIVHLHLGEPIASVIYNPILNKMYFAEKGKGVLINNKKLKNQRKKSLSYISINFSHKDNWSNKRKLYNKLYKSNIKRILNNWSPNLDFCLLAEGKIDAVISNNSLIFDFAPGLLIAREAGFTDYPQITNIKSEINHTRKFVIGKEPDKLYTLVNH